MSATFLVRRSARLVAGSRSRRWLCAPPAPPASAKIEALCDDVCKLNVIELAQFLALFKEKAGLKDSDMTVVAPAAVAPAAVTAAPETVEEAAPTAAEREFVDLKLTGFDAKAKIKVIKEVRAITGLGLKEAKEVVEGVPSVLKKEIKKEEAEALMKQIQECVLSSDLTPPTRYPVGLAALPNSNETPLAGDLRVDRRWRESRARCRKYTVCT